MKAGVVGVGYLGETHLRTLKRIEGVSVLGIYDMNAERADYISSKYNVKKFYSLEDLIDKVDFLIIATPASSHYKIAEAALEKCDLFIEKPVTVFIEEAKMLASKAERLSRKVAVGHVEYFNPVTEKFFSLLEEKVGYVEAQRIMPFSPRNLDVDVVLDLMIHDLHLLSVIDRSNISLVRAKGVPVLTPHLDMVSAWLEFESGLTASIVVSRLSQDKLRKWRVFGEKSYYSLDFSNQSMRLAKLNNGYIVREDVKVEFYYPIERELKEFVAYLKGDPNAKVVNLNDALSALKLALTIKDQLSLREVAGAE